MFAIQSPEVALLRAKYLLLDTTKTQVQDRVEEIIPQEVNSEPSQEDILHDQNLYQACIHEIASIKERSTSRGLHVPLNNYDVHQILQTIDTYTKKQRSHIQSLNFYTLKLHYLKLQRQIGSTR
ncbi:MAG: hypothetical protein H6767_09055 [Candidatus Peribacteria bacterium]|nr:MAG: hypothetical protein H6767_09055 [Candidatus Peribacteria bacterium]